MRDIDRNINAILYDSRTEIEKYKNFLKRKALITTANNYPKEYFTVAGYSEFNIINAANRRSILSCKAPAGYYVLAIKLNNVPSDNETVMLEVGYAGGGQFEKIHCTALRCPIMDDQEANFYVAAFVNIIDTTFSITVTNPVVPAFRFNGTISVFRYIGD